MQVKEPKRVRWKGESARQLRQAHDAEPRPHSAKYAGAQSRRLKILFSTHASVMAPLDTYITNV